MSEWWVGGWVGDGLRMIGEVGLSRSGVFAIGGMGYFVLVLLHRFRWTWFC